MILSDSGCCFSIMAAALHTSIDGIRSRALERTVLRPRRAVSALKWDMITSSTSRAISEASPPVTSSSSSSAGGEGDLMPGVWVPDLIGDGGAGGGGAAILLAREGFEVS